MDLNDWLIFSQIVESGGLGPASRRLGTPKSTLSRRLARLESDFGSRLLNRRGGNFELTEAGHLLYQEALKLSEQVASARDRLLEANQQESGRLRMAAPITPGKAFLGHWLAAFLKTHPQIHIELDLSDQLVNLFEQGYDLALRVGPLADSSLIARKLAQTERLLVASPEYLQQHGLPQKPEDLLQHACIGFSEQRNGHAHWHLSQGQKSQRIDFYPSLRCNDMATSLHVACSGAGIAMAPAFTCKQELENGKLQRILPQWTGPLAEFYLVYPERKLIPRRVRRLIEHLIDCAQKEAGKFSTPQT